MHFIEETDSKAVEEGFTENHQQSIQSKGWSGKLQSGKALCYLSYNGARSCFLQVVFSSILLLFFSVWKHHLFVLGSLPYVIVQRKVTEC